MQLSKSFLPSGRQEARALDAIFIYHSFFMLFLEEKKVPLDDIMVLGCNKSNNKKSTSGRDIFSHFCFCNNALLPVYGSGGWFYQESKRKARNNVLLLSHFLVRLKIRRKTDNMRVQASI